MPKLLGPQVNRWSDISKHVTCRQSQMAESWEGWRQEKPPTFVCRAERRRAFLPQEVLLSKIRGQFAQIIKIIGRRPQRPPSPTLFGVVGNRCTLISKAMVNINSFIIDLQDKHDYETIARCKWEFMESDRVFIWPWKRDDCTDEDPLLTVPQL